METKKIHLRKGGRSGSWQERLEVTHEGKTIRVIPCPESDKKGKTRHDWEFYAARRLVEEFPSLTEDEAVWWIERHLTREPTPANEVEVTVEKAWAMERGESVRTTNTARRWVSMEPLDVNPHRLIRHDWGGDHPEPQFFLRELFPDSMVCIGDYTWPEIGEVDKIVQARYDDAQFVTANRPLTREGRKADNFRLDDASRDYLVVEFDELTIEEQEAQIVRLAQYAPLTMVVFSGGKSLHAWFRVTPEATEDDVRRFYGQAVAQGACISTWNIHQWVRLPGARRWPSDQEVIDNTVWTPEKRAELPLQEVLYWSPEAAGRWDTTRFTEASPEAEEAEKSDDYDDYPFDEPSPEEVDGGSGDDEDAPYSPPTGWSPSDCKVLQNLHFPENDPGLPPEKICGLLQEGGRMTISGPSKARKSFIMMALAVCAAAGKEWWGFSIPKPQKVIYVDMEIGERAVRHRMHKIARALNCPFTEKNVLIRSAVDKDAMRMDFDTFMAHLEADVWHHDPGILFLDPLYNLIAKAGVSENDNSEVAKILINIAGFLGTSSCLIYSQHFSKGNQAGKDAMDRISGAGSFARWPDTIMTMTPLDEDECFSVETTMRHFKPIDPFGVRVEHPLVSVDESLDPSSLRDARTGGSEPKVKSCAVLAKLEDGMTFSEWCDAVGTSDSTMRRYIRQVKDMIRVETGSRNSKKYFHNENAAEEVISV